MDKIKNFLQKYEIKIVLILGFLLVAGLSFEAGLIQGRKTENKPLVIENASQGLKNELKTVQSQETLNSSSIIQKTNLSPNAASKKDCVFVGSKNSNKYHLPTCHWAKRIKPENIVCFKDIQDSTNKGYLPDKTCNK